MSVPLTHCEDYVITAGTSIINNFRHQNKIGAAWCYLEKNSELDDITNRYHNEGKALRPAVGVCRSHCGELHLRSQKGHRG
jgi:protein-arginine kinase activator protein McsA